MAIFDKPPAKKPPSAKPAARGAKREAHVVSARELAAQAASRKAGMPEKPLGLEPPRRDEPAWRERHRLVHRAEGDRSRPGESGVVRHAGERRTAVRERTDRAARELLEQGVQTDQDTKLSPLAWLALFDLLQRADDRVGFDLLAMQFVLQFERSAPSWNERSRPPTDDKPGGGGYIAVTRQALQQQLRTTRRPEARAGEVRPARPG